jgi:hypothetical protein
MRRADRVPVCRTHLHHRSNLLSPERLQRGLNLPDDRANQHDQPTMRGRQPSVHSEGGVPVCPTHLHHRPIMRQRYAMQPRVDIRASRGHSDVKQRVHQCHSVRGWNHLPNRVANTDDQPSLLKHSPTLLECAVPNGCCDLHHRPNMRFIDRLRRRLDLSDGCAYRHDQPSLRKRCAVYLGRHVLEPAADVHHKHCVHQHFTVQPWVDVCASRRHSVN